MSFGLNGGVGNNLADRVDVRAGNTVYTPKDNTSLYVVIGVVAVAVLLMRKK
ncbi:MAG: hypothetical protein AB2687_00495 [Candidatus Thiodiazotropha taylori]